MPRRKGFNVHQWRANCKCKHTHEEHDPVTRRCKKCGCSQFQSAYRCVACDQSQEDHETVFESEAERRQQGLPCGRDFFPLADNPAIQDAVFGEHDDFGVARSPMEHGAEAEMLQAYQRGLKPAQTDRAERSIRLTHTSRGGMATGSRLNRWGKVGTEQEALMEEQRTGFARLEGPPSGAEGRAEWVSEVETLALGDDRPHTAKETKSKYYEQQVVRFYEEHNPDKIDDGTVDRLLDKYRGKEHLLLKKVTEKYGKESVPGVAGYTAVD